MNETDRDTQLRMAAFAHVRRLTTVHDPLTGKDLAARSTKSRSRS